MPKPVRTEGTKPATFFSAIKKALVLFGVVSGGLRLPHVFRQNSAGDAQAGNLSLVNNTCSLGQNTNYSLSLSQNWNIHRGGTYPSPTFFGLESWESDHDKLPTLDNTNELSEFNEGLFQESASFTSLNHNLNVSNREARADGKSFYLGSSAKELQVALYSGEQVYSFLAEDISEAPKMTHLPPIQLFTPSMPTIALPRPAKNDSQVSTHFYPMTCLRKEPICPREERLTPFYTTCVAPVVSYPYGDIRSDSNASTNHSLTNLNASLDSEKNSVNNSSTSHANENSEKGFEFIAALSGFAAICAGFTVLLHPWWEQEKPGLLARKAAELALMSDEDINKRLKKEPAMRYERVLRKVNSGPLSNKDIAKQRKLLKKIQDSYPDARELLKDPRLLHVTIS